MPDTTNSPTKRSHRKTIIVQRTLVLENVNGLHARPAELLVKRVAKFQSRVIVQCGGESTDARSLFGLLSLAAGWQSKLSFTAKGEDAAETLAAIEQLFASRFGEAYQTSAAASDDEGSKVLPRNHEAHDSNSEYENDA